MKVLVTGGAGFIASHIVDAYLAEGHDVVVVDNLATGQEKNINTRARFYNMDIRHPDLRRILLEERPQVINHHAAQTMVGPSTQNPDYDLDVNLRGLLNLLQGAVAAGVQKIIFASSGGTVYGLSEHLPISEGQPLDPQSPYGITKAASEWYIRFFHTTHELNFTILRYANIYGPRDHVSSEHVITVFTERLLQGRRAVIHWDGEQAKDYLYIDDVVRINSLALTMGDQQIYNVGSGRATSVNEIFDRLTKIIGSKQPPEYGPKRPGDVRLFYLDSSLARQELGWNPRVDLQTGLERTITWYRER
ncbi:MAG: GDP-mannose 4,6-dehydratase [Chloroflexi bacterium]|nr:GDP-mannose 4,6-dehydratase [Chloroflexota bacterium]